MKIETSYYNINHLFQDIFYNRIIIPSYQRKYCWNDKKKELFIDSLLNDIPIGVFQFRAVENQQYEVIDGLHRIRTILNILLGRGFYFNFEQNIFTLNNNDFNYENLVLTNDRISTMVMPFGFNSTNEENKKTKKLSIALEKIYFTQLLYFKYSGSDDEIKKAFDRINMDGVTFTPIFNKVDKAELLTINNI